MKILYPILSFALLCGLRAQAQISYSISGKLKQPDIEKMFLVSLETNTILNSVEVQDNKYELSGEIDYPQFGLLTNKDYSYSIPIYIDGVPMSVGGDKFKGSALNQKFMAINLPKWTQKWEKHKDKNEKRKVIQGAIASNMDNLIPAYLLHSYFNDLETDFVERTLQSYTTYCQHPFVEEAKAELKEAKQIEVGGTLPAFTQNDLEGNAHSLSEYLGKSYVLVDFWASWCVPCRREIPTIKQAYAHYAPQGFQVVSISMDKDHAAWQKCVAQYGLIWPQLSDLKGWHNQAAKRYKVRVIPTTFLLSPDGKIIAKDLRGTALLNKLTELYD